MVAHITILQLKPGIMDDLIRMFQDAIGLAAAEQQGFKSMTLLINDNEGQAMAISLWATAADLLSSERSSVYGEQLAQVDNLLDAPPVRQVYEVGVQIDLSPEGRAHIRGI